MLSPVNSSHKSFDSFIIGQEILKTGRGYQVKTMQFETNVTKFWESLGIN
jgi:hypothetical protein